MKHIPPLLIALGFAAAPAIHAQHVGGVGAVVDYYHLQATDQHFAGIGARASLALSPNVQLEADLAYDFSQAFTEGFTDPISGSIVLQQSNVRVVHGLIGPKFETGGAVRLFVTMKGGFNTFHFDPRPATFATFRSSVQNLRTRDVNGVVYPGGGIEAFLGPVALRVDVGDEIYFADGAHHNLRVSVGPAISF